MNSLVNLVIDDLLAIAGTGRWPTFVDLEEVMTNHGIDWQGNKSIWLPDVGNVLLWTGFNETSVGILTSIVRDGRLKMAPMVDLAYQAAGKTIDLPLVDGSVKPDAFDEPHWLPIVFEKVVR